MRTRKNWNLKAKYRPQSFVQNELFTKYVDICFIKYKINEIEQKFKEIVRVRDHPAILLSRFHGDTDRYNAKCLYYRWEGSDYIYYTVILLVKIKHLLRNILVLPVYLPVWFALGLSVALC